MNLRLISPGEIDAILLVVGPGLVGEREDMFLVITPGLEITFGSTTIWNGVQHQPWRLQLQIWIS